jgi:hypothetical protein
MGFQSLFANGASLHSLTSPTTGKLDDDQKGAFEVIICAFIQTYWHNAAVQDATQMNPSDLLVSHNKWHKTLD